MDIFEISPLFLCLNSIVTLSKLKFTYLPSEIYVHLAGTCVDKHNKLRAVFPDGAIVQLYFRAIALATSLTDGASYSPIYSIYLGL